MTDIKINKDLNMITLLKRSLEKTIKINVVDLLVKEQMESFEAKLRERLVPMVENLSIDGVDKVRDLFKMREELQIFLSWKGEVFEDGTKHKCK